MPWLVEIKNQVVTDLTQMLAASDAAVLPRDDYRECVENTLLVLGATRRRGVHFLKPGADTKRAGWNAISTQQKCLCLSIRWGMTLQ